MPQIMTLGPSILQRAITPQPVNAEVLPPEQPDEFGRDTSKPEAPLVESQFNPRVIDRRNQLQPPWDWDQIADALQAVEGGNMQAQSELFEHMEERDGELGGLMQTRRLAPCGLKWSIEPANDSPEAKAIADMVSTEINAITNFPLAFRDMQDAIGKGIAALQIDWQEGGRTPYTTYRINAINHISPKRYRFDWKAERFLIMPDINFGGTPNPLVTAGGYAIGIQPAPWKVILHRTRLKSGHPAKAGVLRVTALPFMIRNLVLKDGAAYCEIFGIPFRVFKYPEGASDEDRAKLRAAAVNMGTDSFAIISKLMEYEIHADMAKQGGLTPFRDLDQMCLRRMQLAIVGQDQTNTHNEAGGRTQVAEGGAKVRQDILEADAIDNEVTLTTQLCYPIVGFSTFEKPYVDQNTGRTMWPTADSLCPKFKIHYEPEGDYESMIAVDVPLHTVLKLPTTVGQLAKRYNRELPKGVDPEKVVDFTTPPPNDLPLAPRANGNDRNNSGRSFAALLTQALTFAEVKRSSQQSAIDDLGDKALAATEGERTALAKRIVDIAGESSGYHDFMIRLKQSGLDDLDLSTLETVLRRNVFVAQLAGHVNAQRKAENQ